MAFIIEDPKHMVHKEIKTQIHNFLESEGYEFKDLVYNVDLILDTGTITFKVKKDAIEIDNQFTNQELYYQFKTDEVGTSFPHELIDGLKRKIDKDLKSLDNVVVRFMHYPFLRRRSGETLYLFNSKGKPVAFYRNNEIVSRQKYEEERYMHERANKPLFESIFDT